MPGNRYVRFAGLDGKPQRAAVEELPVEPLDGESLELPPPFRLLAPVEPPEVWGAGVTYLRSRDARVEESEAKDLYTLVYDADRPELFLKDAAGRRTVGPGDAIAVRSDSAWTVPEPEIGLVLGEAGAIMGVTIGNDVSSRSIEGTNPLYLPQAKIYAGACALGPAVLEPDDWSQPFAIEMRILSADGRELYAGETATDQMRRSFEELATWLVRENPVPPGQRAADRHGPRAPRRLHARARPRRRDPRPRHRTA